MNIPLRRSNSVFLSLVVVLLLQSQLGAQDFADRFDAKDIIVHGYSLGVIRDTLGKKLGNLDRYHVIAITYQDQVTEAVALVIRSSKSEKDDDDPFGTNQEGDEELEMVLLHANKNKDVAAPISVEMMEKWRRDILAVLKPPGSDEQLKNLASMQALGDERHCLLFVRDSSALIGGKIFNPKKGTRTERLLRSVKAEMEKLRKKT